MSDEVSVTVRCVDALCVDFGDGGVVVTSVRSGKWAGLCLSESTDGPHAIGESLQTVLGEDGVCSLPDGSIFLRFKNVESLDVVMDALQEARDRLMEFQDGALSVPEKETPDDSSSIPGCPHAAPRFYCDGCKVSPCPMGPGN
jgi:hypothetical protein